jgi:flagellar hook-associated protein 1 FlgK
MGVNFSSFEIGRRALRASQLGVTIAGQNIANVNTPGYSRQAIQLSATPVDGSNIRLTGVGVTIDGVKAFRDRFVESRLQTETGITGRLTAKRDALAPVDAALNETTSGGGISSAITGFFNSFRDLEANPASVEVRAAVVGKGSVLAEAFHQTRARLVDIRREADGALRSAASEVNALSARIADLNVQISVAENTGANAHELRDQRGEALRQLAELTGARTVENQDGTVTVTLGDGRPLVQAGRVWSLDVASAPPDGLAALQLDGAPAIISDGRLRGLLDAIGEIGAQIGALDDLAASITARVNALHASGADLDGNAGTNFFAVPSGGQPVTAANINVSAQLAANPRLVVAAAVGGGSGDATVARSIGGLLTDQTSVAGSRTGSFSSIYASIVKDAGDGVRDAEDSLVTQQAILAQAAAQRDAASGVSLDEEAINLLQYQKAYEAAARFLKVADEMTQTIISLGQ